LQSNDIRNGKIRVAQIMNQYQAIKILTGKAVWVQNPPAPYLLVCFTIFIPHRPLLIFRVLEPSVRRRFSAHNHSLNTSRREPKMIKQLMERGFIHRSADTLSKVLESNVQQADSSQDLQKFMEQKDVKKADLEQAKQDLNEAIGREENRASKKEDKVVFFPRDPVISLVQSSLQDYCDTRKPNEIVKKSDAVRGAAADEIPITDKELSEDLRDFLAPEKEKLFSDFEKLDLGWANCTLAAGLRAWRGRHPFNPSPATPYKIGNNARVILVSDWASGLPRARKVADAIRLRLNDAEAASRDKHVIHLGDVYYSGWANEYAANFLSCWPVDKPEQASSWSLNANHDMYSGGKGYFEYLLADQRFQAQERSSFFSLENDNWQLLGLDTGYHTSTFDPHDLYGDQNLWISQRLTNVDKTGILLSHHQPFSAFESGGDKILEKLQGPLAAGHVRGWFWGHEHRCTLYKASHNIQYPRCIGHGGIPFYVETDPLPEDKGVIYEYRDGIEDLFELWNYFGFIVLDFDADVINVRYINELNNEHKSETFTRK
jgi:hypothetical protein